MRPPVEKYVRSVVEANGIELVLGVQYDNAVEYMGLLAVSKMLLRDAVDSLSGSHAVTNPALLAEAVEAKVKEQWPERLFFLEVCSATERDGWVQCYSGQASKLEERIVALESRPSDPFGITEDDWAKALDRINRHDSTSRGMPAMPLRVTPIFGAGQESHTFECAKWQAAEADCTCPTGETP